MLPRAPQGTVRACRRGWGSTTKSSFHFSVDKERKKQEKEKRKKTEWLEDKEEEERREEGGSDKCGKGRLHKV